MESDLQEDPSMDTSPSPHRQAVVRERASPSVTRLDATQLQAGLSGCYLLEWSSRLASPRTLSVPQPLLPSGHIQGHGSWAAVTCSWPLILAAPPA